MDDWPHIIGDKNDFSKVESRRKILQAISDGWNRIGEIEMTAKVSRPTISQHIEEMKVDKVVVYRKSLDKEAKEPAGVYLTDKGRVELQRLSVERNNVQLGQVAVPTFVPIYAPAYAPNHDISGAGWLRGEKPVSEQQQKEVGEALIGVMQKIHQIVPTLTLADIHFASLPQKKEDKKK